MLLGPNGCGKGTVARSYLETMGVHIETMSDVLEYEKNTNPVVAEIIRHYKHDLKVNVPCEVAVDAMIKRIRRVFRQKHSGLFVLDGAGRTTTQIEQIPQRIWVRRPETKIGCVFLTLSLEGTLERTAKRIEKFKAEGMEVRAEDLGDEPKKRYETYIRTQEALISRARAVTGDVTIFDLEKHTTLEVAARILEKVVNVPAVFIEQQIREKTEFVN